MLINAGRDFQKGVPKNYLTEPATRKIADAFLAGIDVGGFAKAITIRDAASSDYNLSPSRYATASRVIDFRSLLEIRDDLRILEQEVRDTDEALARALDAIGA
jgi:type I restriction enzyme M protein